MFKKRKKYLVLFLLIPLMILAYYLFLRIEFPKVIKTGEPINLGMINHKGESKEIELSLIYGDVIEPKKYNNDLDFDLVPISCFIDPMFLALAIDPESKEINLVVVWENNYLLRSALESTIEDEVVFDRVIEELVSNMVANKELINYFYGSETKSEYELRQKAKVYIWDIEKESNYFKNNRVLQIAALPIFSPTYFSDKYTNREIHKKLEENLSISIKRLFKSIYENQNKEINSIAFAALAGSTQMVDSELFLNYDRSFTTIYNSIQNSEVPEQIDKIYLVAYNNLPSKQQEIDSINGLLRIYLIKKITYFPMFENEINDIVSKNIIKSIPYVVVFLLTSILIDKRWQAVKKKIIQYLFIITSSIIGISTIHSIIILSIKVNVIFFITLEFVFATALYFYAVWINNRLIKVRVRKNN